MEQENPGTRASPVRSRLSSRTSSRKTQARLQPLGRTHFRSSLSSPNVTVSFLIKRRSKALAQAAGSINKEVVDPPRRAAARAARPRLRIASRKNRLAVSRGKKSKPSSKLTPTSRRSTPITLLRTRCQRKTQSRRTPSMRRRCPCLKTSRGT